MRAALRRALLVCLAAVALLAFTACGDEEETTPAPSGGGSEPTASSQEDGGSGGDGIEVKSVEGDYSASGMLLTEDALYIGNGQKTLEVDPATGETRRTIELAGTDMATDGKTLWASIVRDEKIYVAEADLDSGKVKTGPLLPVPFNPIGPVYAGGYLWWGYYGSSVLLRQKPGSKEFTEVKGIGTEIIELTGGDDGLWMIGDEGVILAKPSATPEVVAEESASGAQNLGVGEDAVVAYSGATVFRFDPATGKQLTPSLEIEGLIGDATAGPSGIWVSNGTKQEIHRVDPETGEITATASGFRTEGDIAVGENGAFAIGGERGADASLKILTLSG